MIFCGQCGYQLAPGDTTCPRCGARAEADPQAPGATSHNPTEISHAVLDLPKMTPPPVRRVSQPRLPTPPPPEPAGPLVLGANYPNEQLANEATSMMSSQMYVPQPSYPNYPPQVVYQQPMNTGVYAYNPAFQQQQAAQAAALAEILESSRKGKTTALLLILFGLLLLIGAIVVLLLTLQGIIFTA